MASLSQYNHTFLVNGLPAVVHLLDVFLAGTSTRATTYQNSALSVAHTNPIVLDANGQPPGQEIFAAAGLTFDLVLRTPGGAATGQAWNNIATTGGDVLALRAELAAENGLTKIGYKLDAVAAVYKSAEYKARERVSVFDWMTEAEIADVKAGAALLDVTAAITKARNYIAGNPRGTSLLFPAGVYRYSLSPNWAIRNSHVWFEGHVVLRYTGTESAVVFDASAPDAVVFVPGLCYSFCWGWENRPTIEAHKSAKHGIYVRSCHHSKIGGRVRGCGTAYDGLRVEFAVVTEFDVAVTGNQDGWYNDGTGAAKPLNGYFLSRRNPGETTSYCTFVNPIVEGPSVGIYLDRTLGNVFIGGTSEACSQYGVFANQFSAQDRFYGTDFEVNTIADLFIQGTGLVFSDCDTYTYTVFGSLSKECTLRGGRHSRVLLDSGSANCLATDLVYNRFNDASTMQDAGNGNVVRNVLNIGTGNRYLTGSLATAGVVGIANGTNSIITGIPVVGSRVGDKVLAAFNAAIPGLTLFGEVSSDGFVRAVFSNNSGATQNLPAGVCSVSVFRG